MKKFRRILAALISAAVVGSASVAPTSAIGFVLVGDKYYTQGEYELLKEKFMSKYTFGEYYIDVEEEYLTATTDENGNTIYALIPGTDLYESLNTINGTGNTNISMGRGSGSGDTYYLEAYRLPRVTVTLTDTNKEAVAEKIKSLKGVKEIVLMESWQYVSGQSFTGEPVDIDPLSGDLSMDGKVNIVDAVKLAKYNADPTAFPLLTYSQLAADINGDGELTNADLVALIQMI